MSRSPKGEGYINYPQLLKTTQLKTHAAEGIWTKNYGLRQLWREHFVKGIKYFV